MKRFIAAGILALTLASNVNAGHRSPSHQITEIADCSGSTCIDNEGHVVKVAPMSRKDTIFNGRVRLISRSKAIYALTNGSRTIRVKIKES